MFRVEFFVDDKRLGPALFALVGIAHGQPGVVPVVNAKLKGKAVVTRSNGGTMERLSEELKAHKGKLISANDMREMMKPLGLAARSYSYVLKQAKAAKLIKKTGTGQGTLTRYTVL